MVAIPPEAYPEGLSWLLFWQGLEPTIKIHFKVFLVRVPPATPWLELCKTKVSVPYLINRAELGSLSPADGSSLPIN